MAPPPPPQGYHWAAATAFSPLRPWSCFPLLRFRLRFAPPRPRGVAAPVMVADAGPPPTLHLPTEIQFGGGEEEEEEEDEEVDERERLRRMRISQANKGNTPWNKGRKHSPETVQRIRERTRIAMQDPKVKKKLMNLGHAQSEETRIKISEGVRRGWSLRLKKLMVQDGCYVEWLDMIADAARKGFAGGVVLQWNSYRILTEQMRKEWIENHQKRESMPRPRGNRRAPKTPEQRKKIAEAIAAKWLDQEYRERVCSGIANYHGTTAGMKPPQKPQSAMQPGTKREPVKKKTLQPRAVKVQAKHQTTEIVKRKKSVTPYKDPMAGEKLEMITKIRAQRAALEIEKREAIKTARSLIAEAEKAADALEIVAVTSPFAQASLIETRRLVAEARTSLKCVVNDEAPTQNASNDTSEDPAVSELHNCNSESQNGVMASEHKPVNGMDFHFDVSALGEREQPRVSSTIENSMERAYLLPSASTHEDIDKGLSMADFEMSQSILNNQIGAETTGNDPSGTPKDEVSSPVTNTKMRWVCGRLVEVEE